MRDKPIECPNCGAPLEEDEEFEHNCCLACMNGDHFELEEQELGEA